MAYTALRFDVSGEDADAWCDALLAAGALSVEASDAEAGSDAEQAIFAEPGADATSHWRRSRLNALVGEDAEASLILARAARALGVPVPEARRETIEEQDWVRATQAQFGPIAIGRRLHVVPTWCDTAAEGISIRLDPGLAFGTGSHATTRLCLEWLEDAIAGGEAVLDYGCGSGILAIAAAKLGAARVAGTDVDPQALRASAANASLNAVHATFAAPDRLPGGSFDIVVANILANPLILLAPALAARVRRGGRIALSGILETQAEAVALAYARWFTLRAWRAADGWVVLSGERVL
jgi:ribosomal protein L11 methyltransferase